MAIKVLMISGNHDSIDRLSFGKSLFTRSNLYIASQFENEIEKITVKENGITVNFYMLPFVKSAYISHIFQLQTDSYEECFRYLIEHTKIDEEETNILLSHQFVTANKKNPELSDSETSSLGGIDNIDFHIFDPFDYVALGHIHKPMKVGSETLRYCGTPLACSVSEAGQEKGIIVVEMGEKGSTEARVLPLIPLHQVRVIKGTLEEILKEACGDYVTVILTDKVDLDVVDMQERIRLAFPNLLEIRRENQRKSDYTREIRSETLLDPYELCCSFLKELDEQEKEILKDVLHTVQGVK